MLDKEFDLWLIVMGQLTHETFKTECEAILDKFNTIVLPISGADGTLEGMSLHSARIAREVHALLSQNKPDLVTLWADRYELLPIAMVASYLGIPIAHIQGFEVSGNIDDKVRNAVSALADIHFVSHDNALEKAQRSGYENVYMTGCPSLDGIYPYGKKSDHVVSLFHPHTKEIHDMKRQIVEVFNQTIKFCENNNYKLYWFSPNNDPGNIHIHESLKDKVAMITNMAGKEYIELLGTARAIVGNSSSGIREASYLGIPSVVVGDRQAGRFCADNVIRSKPEFVELALNIAVSKVTHPSRLFGDGCASERIINILKGWDRWQKVSKN